MRYFLGIAALLVFALTQHANAMPSNFKLVKNEWDMTPEVIIEPRTSSAIPTILNENDTFKIDTFKNLDEMRESAANVINKCNEDLTCFEKIVVRDNPDYNKVVHDNKENISIQYNIMRRYHLVHKRVVLVAVRTVNNKIISFAVNSGIK